MKPGKFNQLRLDLQDSRYVTAEDAKIALEAARKQVEYACDKVDNLK